MILFIWGDYWSAAATYCLKSSIQSWSMRYDKLTWKEKSGGWFKRGQGWSGVTDQGERKNKENVTSSNCGATLCPNHSAVAASPGSKLWHVVVFLRLRWLMRAAKPANLACNLCHHASLRSFLSVSAVKDWEEEGQQAPGSVQESRLPTQLCSFPILTAAFWSFSIAGIRSTSRWFHLRDKPGKKSCGGTGNKLPTPSPPGHAAFCVPPSISITIAVTAPQARRTRSVGVRNLQHEEADSSRYDRSTQNSTARQKRWLEDGGALRLLPRSQEKTIFFIENYRNISLLMSVKQG